MKLSTKTAVFKRVSLLIGGVTQAPWPRPWGLHNAKNFIILCQMFVNFFSYLPFGVSYFCPRPTTSAVRRLLLSPPKRSKWNSLISAIIWAVSRFFDSLAALFQGTYPKISSGGAPQTFLLAVSFRVWQNQSTFEA